MYSQPQKILDLGFAIVFKGGGHQIHSPHFLHRFKPWYSLNEESAVMLLSPSGTAQVRESLKKEKKN